MRFTLNIFALLTIAGYASASAVPYNDYFAALCQVHPRPLAVLHLKAWCWTQSSIRGSSRRDCAAHGGDILEVESLAIPSTTQMFATDNI
ncbi:hypothetical protein LshimejAT787_0200340 [Lyophyllum shimeji]|uniref:Uncharacterized protein n=1 Tax=Lyophyllum shimeji TaxID=47721 RepID=A0A9P3PFF1_LYOSH|nr:hypothetical protein LshimejAT787_0200340 [Lyophyllum shimeji]